MAYHMGSATGINKMRHPQEQTIAVRVTPRASREKIVEGPEGVRVYVTVAPEGGKANEAVRKLLAKHLGIAKTRLRLIRGAKSRDKVFQII